MGDAILVEFYECIASEAAGAVDPSRYDALRADLDVLGVLGLFMALMKLSPPDPAIVEDLSAKLAQRMQGEMAGAEPSSAAAQPALDLDGIAARFEAAHGEQGPALRRTVVRNVLFDHFGLKDHGLFVEDLDRTLDLLVSARGAGDVKEFVKAIARLSRWSAKITLGHFPDQIGLIYRLTNRDALPREVDEALDDFAPIVTGRRIFALFRKLLPDEVRLRLALILYGWLRGLKAAKPDLLGLAPLLADDRKVVLKLALERAADIHEMACHFQRIAPRTERLERLLAGPAAAPA